MFFESQSGTSAPHTSKKLASSTICCSFLNAQAQAAAAMAVGATGGGETTARKRKYKSGDGVDARACCAPEPFTALPLDVAAYIFREKHLPDPADLAVLRAVSKDTRDAVDATGRKLKKYEEDAAVERGYLSTLKCLRRRGRLSDERLLCAAAARVGDLEALKALRRAENFPWDERTCAYAAKGGLGFRV